MKKVIALCILICIICIPLIGYCDEYSAATVLALDLSTNQTLIDKQSNVVRPIASLTKLMTAIVALDANDDMDEMVKITNDDAIHASLHGYQMSKTLPVGAVISRRQLLLIMLSNSQNRAAVAIARSSKYGYDGFIAKMNEYADLMGLINTKFVEPSGLSQSNVSTAVELAVIARKAFSYVDIQQYSTTKSTILLIGNYKKFNTTNALNYMPTWHLFLQKTGFTNPAGKCMITVSSIKNRTIITVLLNAPSTKSRFADMNKIKTFITNTTFPVYEHPVGPMPVDDQHDLVIKSAHL